ncbi:MAG TPA: ABC transporter permease [Terracidiphilus sp.]|jgi:predicted permease
MTRWIRQLFTRSRRYEDISTSIREHLEERVDELMESGMKRTTAEQTARREFGNVALVEERSREVWQWSWLESLWADAKYALRQMRRSPGYAATVIATLALGIGAAATMFTVVDHVLLRPTPYREAGKLVALEETDGSDYSWLVPWLDIAEWRAQSRSFDQIEFAARLNGRNYLNDNATALQVDAERVSSGLFQMLGIRPSMGRDFDPHAPESNTGTIVLSNVIWKEVFGGDRGILGKIIKINNDSYTVAGIMPPGFRYPVGSGAAPQVWLPIQLDSDDKGGRGFKAMQYNVLARLHPGVTLASSNAEMVLIQKRVAAEYADATLRKDHSMVRVEPYAATLVKNDARRALLALLAASGVLWLIAVVNATNLMLARSTARQREIAMRGALGASRWRVMQQMMVEGLMQSSAAATLGIGLTLGSVRLLAHELKQTLPVPAPASPDLWILIALVVMTVVSALLSTAWPAFLAVRAPIEPALKQGGLHSGIGRRHHLMRGALVAVEIALSLTLVAVCGLLLRSVYALRHVPLGFRTDHILVANLNIPTYRFSDQNMTATLYKPLLERAQHLNGVARAGLMSQVPLGKTFVIHLELSMNGRKIVAVMKAVSPDIQKVFGFHMAAGRFFGPEDTLTSEPVIVVNQAFAREYSPDKHDPAAILGTKLLRLNKNAPALVIGVLDDERQKAVTDPAVPEVEFTIPQITPESGFYSPLEGIAMDLAVRTDRPTAEMIPELKTVLRQASPEFQGATITTMDQIVEDSFGSQRLAAYLLEFFGGSALLLCITGLYGLLAYVVTLRIRELGVRVALGASRGNLLWLVMRQAGAMLIVGVALGSGLALASGRLVRGFLYGVSAYDGWTLGAAAMLLFMTGLAAAYLPARRAAGVDPMKALRAE